MEAEAKVSQHSVYRGYTYVYGMQQEEVCGIRFLNTWNELKP